MPGLRRESDDFVKDRLALLPHILGGIAQQICDCVHIWEIIESQSLGDKFHQLDVERSLEKTCTNVLHNYRATCNYVYLGFG